MSKEKNKKPEMKKVAEKSVFEKKKAEALKKQHEDIKTNLLTPPDAESQLIIAIYTNKRGQVSYKYPQSVPIEGAMRMIRDVHDSIFSQKMMGMLVEMQNQQHQAAINKGESGLKGHDGKKL